MADPARRAQPSAPLLTSLRQFGAAMIAIAPRQVAETGAVMLGLSATEGIGLLLLVPLLQLVGVDAQSGPLTRVTSAFSAVFAAVGVRPTLALVLSVYVAAVAAQSLLERRQAVLSQLLERRMVTALRERLYRAIVGARWTTFARSRASDYTQILTEETARVGMATYWLVDVSVSAVTSLVYVILAARFAPGMTGLVVLCGAVLAVAVRPHIERARTAGQAHSDASSRLYAAIAEHLASLKLARSYGAEGRHADAFARLSVELSDVGLAATRSYSRVRQGLSIGTATVLALIVYVSYTVLAVSTAQLLLLLFLFGRLVPRLTTLYQKVQSLATLLPAFAAVIDVERRCIDAAEPPAGPPEPARLTLSIALEQVTFDYHGDGQTPALRDISLTIPAGTTTAIVGPSGAGKSTVVDVVMGFLDPSDGRVLIDGKRLIPAQLADWRRRIGYVPQDPFLFHDTIRGNLLWARPDAGDRELWTALRLAAADGFVTALPRGLDTVVGDRGVLISGGERQRLSLARALLRDPALLILDEATSSLDSENESRIQQAIANLHQRMTIIVITHRLSTVRDVDMIHVLDGGLLIESGTWDELMTRRSGRLRALGDAQGLDDRFGAGVSLPVLT